MVLPFRQLCSFTFAGPPELEDVAGLARQV